MVCSLLVPIVDMYSLFLCCSSLLLLASIAWSALPGNLEICKLGSTDYSHCLATQINNAINLFKDGNKKMGVNSIDPFKFTKLSIEQGSGPVAIKLDLKNFDMIGLSKMKVKEVTNDWKTMVIKANLDSLECVGEYSIEGKVMVLPISGTGKCKFITTEVDIIATLKFSEIEKGGKTHFKVNSFDVDINPTKSVFDFQNLFNGDKRLGDNMNLFLNENHDQIIKELKPAISKGLSAGFAQLSNQVLSKIEASEIKF